MKELLIYSYRALETLGLIPVGLALLVLRLQKREYRDILFQRLGFIDLDGVAERRKCHWPCIWLHALSFGEVRASAPLLKAIVAIWPNAFIVTSATTPTGIAEMKRISKGVAHMVFPLPLDIYPCFRRILNQVRPDCFLLVETDVWPNMLWSMKKMGTVCMLVNGAISEKASQRIARMPGLGHFLYGAFHKVFLQSQKDMERMLTLGLDPGRVSSLGNLKMDFEPHRLDPRAKAELSRRIGAVAQKRTRVVCGSTHPGEEALILDALLDCKCINNRTFLIFVPRRPERAMEVMELSRKRGLNPVLWSDLKHSEVPNGGGKTPEVLVVDTLGELMDFYSIAHVAVLGGTFVKVGGHNVLEPASFGLPTVVGPFVESIQDICEEMLEQGGLLMAKDQKDLSGVMQSLLTDPDRRRDVGTQAMAYFVRARGVTERYVKEIQRSLEEGRR